MLSIAQMSSGNSSYYTKLAQQHEENELERRGYWLGSGAHALELSGPVNPNELDMLLSGRSPSTKRDLVNQGRGHHPGWDLCFSAPKSVSIAWGVGDDALKSSIQQAHDLAVEKSIHYLETHAGRTRRGHGGVRTEPAKCIVAAFRHGTSRANEPQLHTHALMMNVGIRADQSIGTIRGRDLFQHKMAAGAIYRVALSYELRSLGFALEMDRGFFRLKAIPRDREAMFSSRSTEVQAELERHNVSGPRATEKAVLATRSRKSTLDDRELGSQWRRIAGFGLRTPQLVLPRHHVNLHMTGKLAVSDLERYHSYFHERDVVRQIANLTPPGSADVAAVLDAAQEATRSSRVRSVGIKNGHEVFATKANIKIERRMALEAQELSKRDRHVVSDRTRSKVEAGRSLTEEQKVALAHLSKSPDLALIEGLAGTGKTYLLDAARESWEKSGYRVHGLALAGVAARALQDGAGIPSQTIASFFDSKAHEKLNGKSILVVDESSMIATRGFNAIMRAARVHGAKVCFVGDYRQLPAIEAGGPFLPLCATHSAASLKNIVRQHEEWHRHAITDLGHGRVAQALRQYALAERLHADMTPEAARVRLVKAWGAERTSDLSQTLVLANTNEDRNQLNRTLQDLRKEAGELGRSIKWGKNQMHERDRVVVCSNNRAADYFNGDSGTIERVRRGLLGPDAIVRLDRTTKSGRAIRASVPLDDLDLGYALTSYKAQGSTVERAFVMGSELQSAQALYVQASRARGITEFFFSGSKSLRDLLANVNARVHSIEKPLINNLEHLRGLDLMR